VRFFLAKPAWGKYFTIARRVRLLFPQAAIPFRLSFGAWWLARNDHVGKPVSEGCFETAEAAFVERFLHPGMTVLDIGAHHGLYTLLASKLVGPAGTVVAFEPSPRERKALLQHLKLNRCRNVTVEALALGSEEQEAVLHVVDGHQTGCNSLRPPIVETGTSPVRVQLVRLGDWLRKRKIDRVDFIKMDVEGGELEVLKGAEQLLERRPRPVIFAEVQDVRTQPWGYRAKEIIDHLRERGYQWFRISPEGFLEELDVSRDTYDENLVACPEECAAALQRVKRASSPDPKRAAEERNGGS